MGWGRWGECWRRCARALGCLLLADPRRRAECERLCDELCSEEEGAPWAELQ